MNLPHLQAMPLQRRAEPCDDPELLYELKYNGFRALAYVAAGQTRLVSRNGNTFRRFETVRGALAGAAAAARNAVIDGEIVCLDDHGRPQFNQLLFGRGQPCFAAFDLLWLDGQDLRTLPLERRKQMLAQVLRPAAGVLRVDHVLGDGSALFRMVCERDLEGIVAKRRDGVYVAERERSTWWKIKNRAYSQMAGRFELFESRGVQ